MSIESLTALLIGLLAIQLLLGVPFAVATGMTAVVIALINFGPASLMIIAGRILDISDSYALLAVPMFILMGCILEKSGVAEQLFSAMHRLTRRLPGGLAIGTVLAATVMSAMVGVVGAEVVMLGLVALPAMLRRGYDRKLATGVIVAGGSLGTMMPPSLVLVMYGIIANVSISDLFLASITPALLLAGMYVTYVLIRCWLQPGLAPKPLPGESAESASAPGGGRGWVTLLIPVLIIGLVMGSLYAGVATPTEAAALGVLGAVVAAVLNHRASLQTFWDATRQTAQAIGPVVWIFFGANAMVNVYALAGGIDFIKSAFLGLGLEPWLLMLVIMAFLFVLGIFLDWIGIAFLTLPVFVPIVVGLGLDPIWFGILFCLNMQMSYISPPFGPACFYLKGVAPEGMSLGEIYSSVWPFLGMQAAAVLLLLTFPGLALWILP